MQDTFLSARYGVLSQVCVHVVARILAGLQVVSNTSVTPGMHLLVINCGDVLAASYTKPGQYVQVRMSATQPRVVVQVVRKSHNTSAP
jgi:hypothetical protein